MRVKNILILAVLAAFSYSAAAQQAKLQVSNFAPRVGDEIAVSVVYYDANQPEKEKDPHFNNMARADFKINKLVTKTGSLWIGPFTFRVGDELLTTDSVELIVTSALPVKDTVLIRQVRAGNVEYLIVEQIIEKKEKGKYVKLKKRKVKNGVTINDKNSFESSFHQGSHKHYYTRQTFSLIKNKDYKGGSIITPKHFKRLPANITLNNYEIL